MYDKISQNPPLLCKGAAGKRTWSIFRVPKRLVDINDHFYEPNSVSIGPYHRGKPHFQMIEEHKWRYLVTRLPDEESGPSLSLLALRFFKYIMQRRDDIIQSHHDLKGLHLLDMVRSSFFPPDQQECPKRVNNAPTHIIHSVSNLRRLGIRLNPIEADSFLVVKFKHGVIEIPNIAIDDYTTSFLVNCVAFEQCHNSCSKHITTYATFLDCLVKTAKDVEYLYNRNIIEVRHLYMGRGCAIP
uniref:Uncharacterized protein n=1 Tax=Quercus lobata TaxID=97700 RepID=A0A7N2M7E7_QUELO